MKMSAVDQSSRNRKLNTGPRLVEPLTDRPPAKPADKSTIREIPWKRIAIYVVLAMVFFLMGFIPMWLKTRQYAGEREAAQQELRLKQMENQLAAAVINAGRGEYEPARQTASDFFTSLRSQIDRGTDSDLSSLQRDKVKALLAQRDDVITLLARSDPAAVNRLSDLYVTYQKAMKDVGSQTLSEPKPADENEGAVRLALH